MSGKVTCKRTCIVCGKEFLGSPRSKFCSDSCKIAFNRKICVICGKPTNGSKTCSKECFSKLCSINSNRPEIIKTSIEKAKQTKLERYGDPNYNNSKQIEQTKLAVYGKDYYQSHWRKRFTKTMLDTYGVENALQSKQFVDKMNSTIESTGLSYRFGTPEHDEIMIKKYGTTVPYKNDRLKEKGMQTCLSRYGVTSPAKLDWVQEKIRKTCYEHFGVEYNFQSEINKEKSRITMLERYGVENPLQLHRKISNVNKRIGDFLEIKEEDYEFPIQNRSYDLKRDNILIEINPTITHNSTKSIYKDGLPLKETYHKEKSELAESEGYRCIHIWDWDNIDVIKNMLCTPEKKIGARNCEIIFVTKETSDNFLDNYHLQGKCKGDVVRIGLVYQDELVGIMTFGEPRYNKNYEVELLRLCFKPGYKIVGGSEKMFKFFIKNFDPTSIVSYCDRSKFTGSIYKTLGFKLKTKGDPGKHWFNIKTKQHITDNLLRQRGYDQLFNTNFGKGTSNEQLMLDNGFLEVYDCGQDTFVYLKG